MQVLGRLIRRKSGDFRCDVCRDWRKLPMTADNASVSAWVQRLSGGDKGLPVEKLWERYYGRLVALARAKLGGLPRRVADEEDVAFSAFDSFCQGALGGV